MPGIRFYPVTFTPSAGAKLGGQACHGIFVIVTDRDRLKPVRVGLEIAAALSRRHGEQFKLEDAAYLFGSKATLEKIRAGVDPAVDCRGVGGGRSEVAPHTSEVSAGTEHARFARRPSPSTTRAPT